MTYIKHNVFKILTIIFALTTVGSVYLLSRSLLVYNHISLPNYQYTDLPEWGYISVRGTLVSTARDGLASELNAVDFKCDKNSNKCNLIQADIFDDSLLTVSEEEFSITNWDENFVTFETLPENQRCVVWKYRIDRFNQTLEAKREKSAQNSFENCSGIGLNGFSIKVADGWDVISSLRGYTD